MLVESVVYASNKSVNLSVWKWFKEEHYQKIKKEEIISNIMYFNVTLGLTKQKNKLTVPYFNT